MGDVRLGAITNTSMDAALADKEKPLPVLLGPVEGFVVDANAIDRDVIMQQPSSLKTCTEKIVATATQITSTGHAAASDPQELQGEGLRPPLQTGHKHTPEELKHIMADLEAKLFTIDNDRLQMIENPTMERDRLSFELDEQHARHLTHTQELEQQITNLRDRLIKNASQKTPRPRSPSSASPRASSSRAGMPSRTTSATSSTINWPAGHGRRRGSSRGPGGWRRPCAASCRFPFPVASDKKASPALMEAAVWKMLVNNVLGKSDDVGSMIWAGNYRKMIRPLSSLIRHGFVL